KPYVEVSGPGGRHRVLASVAIAAQSWHHLAVTAGTNVSLYLDGASVGSGEGSLPALNGIALLGGTPVKGTAPVATGKKDINGAPPATAPVGFKGELDELEISKVERSASFIKVAAFSQGSDAAKMVTSGQDEQSGSFGSGYFSIILQSVTPDG